MRKTRSKAVFVPVWLLAVLLIAAACAELSPVPAPPEPSPVQNAATPAPLPTEQETVASPPTPIPAAPDGTLIATLPPELTPLPGATIETLSEPTAALPDETGPLPKLLARIPLAPTDGELVDLAVDHDAGRLYVTDSAGKLYVLDATTFEELATLLGSGELTLDAANNRLYASKPDGGSLTIVDTGTLEVVGTISAGGMVALDPGRDRFYVGNPVHFATDETISGVRVYNAQTLEKVGEVPQPGIPVYNPLRDELYIVNYTVHAADPTTLQISSDLLPEITEQSIPWCNGCWAATNAHVYPDRNLLVVEVTILSAGKGPGTLPPPRFFDATTLDELTDLAEMPPVERDCQGRLILAEPVAGRAYRGHRYSRYITLNNLMVYSDGGELDTWRDGLGLGMTNPQTGQMYVPHGGNLLVLDLATLSPAGSLPPLCVHSLDQAERQIYAFAGHELVVLTDQGGLSALASPEQAASGSMRGIAAILPSPDYARDHTLFATTPSQIFRSTDGGQTWQQLRGGLPEGPYWVFDLAISPGYADDSTLFVGGFQGDAWGSGVYRSTDGGDSWQPMWQGLDHLRVYEVALSPDYVQDGTVLAYSNYNRIDPWHSGQSLFRSTDQGLSWTLVLTQSRETNLPTPEQVVPSAKMTRAVQFRVDAYGDTIERSLDAGQTWEPLIVTREPQFRVTGVATSPSFGVDSTVYVLAASDLYRSTDGGESWARWVDERMEGRDYTNLLATLAVSPRLNGGQHILFVGTAAGEFWSLDPATLRWEPVQIAEQWPTVLEGARVSRIEPSPGGGLWLGTWGQGLARYADGAIQARYTVTDGLSTQYIGGLAEAPDGTLWAGGDLPPSMSAFDGQAWTVHPFDEKDGVGGVRAVAAGSDGTIWVGAQAPGLVRWSGQNWELIEDPEALTGWRVNDIELGQGGTLWLATAGGLVFYYEDALSGGLGSEATAIEFGLDGTVYLANLGGSVWRHDGEQWTRLPAPREGTGPSIAALHVADDGAVWVGTYKGAFRYDGRTWRQFTAQDGLADNKVTAIATDSDGWLWFGTENGAARVDPATLALSPVVLAEPTIPMLAAQPIPIPQAVPSPTPCARTPDAAFAGILAVPEIAARIGCPAEGVVTTPAAWQPFEQGVMVWRADERSIYVLSTGGEWERYADTWDESQPAFDAGLTPPDGLQQPIRGFGKLWREHLGGPQANTGWAVGEERALKLVTQAFAGGYLIAGPDSVVWVLYPNGQWE